MTSARLALAFLVCVAGLAACGGDDGAGADPARPSTASTESTAPPVETPSPSEPTPTVEPADGLKLKHDLAEITMPKGWRRENNFGVPFIRQGGDGIFGLLTFSELGGEDDQATSLDRIAKRQLRMGSSPGMKRMDDVVLGDGTRAYRLHDGVRHHRRGQGDHRLDARHVGLQPLIRRSTRCSR